MCVLCPSNQTVEHSLKGLAAQLVVLVRLLLFQAGIFQIGADAVLKNPKLGNGIRDAQPRYQRLFFQNGGEHGLIEVVKGSPTGC